MNAKVISKAHLQAHFRRRVPAQKLCQKNVWSRLGSVVLSPGVAVAVGNWDQVSVVILLMRKINLKVFIDEPFRHCDLVASFHKSAFDSTPLAVGARFFARALNFALTASNTSAYAKYR